jgi:site-specific DNA-methyltransferase (adenine-specific)
MNEIYNKNAKRIPDLVQSDIDITITSPPYANSINYEKHQEGGDYKDRDEMNLSEFISNQEEIFKKIFDNTKDGGFCCIIIGMAKREDTSKVALPHRFAVMMEDIGWKLHESIVWHKVTGGVRRFGVTIQHPYPGYYYPNQMYEEIQVWRKGDISREKIEEDKIELNEFVKKEIANNVWNIPPEPPGKYTDIHPCPFPEEIPYRLIKLYSNTGDTVCDPMAGIGTTLKVAKHLNRDYIGTEISEDYVSAARERIDNEEYDRREQLIADYNKTSDNI